MNYQFYPSDLADREWEGLTPLIPAAKIGGRPRTVDMRLVLNAIFYVVRTGCAWRYVPREYPPWQTVYGYYRRWSKDGTWAQINDQLRVEVRQSEGRERQPSAAILDSHIRVAKSEGVNTSSLERFAMQVSTSRLRPRSVRRAWPFMGIPLTRTPPSSYRGQRRQARLRSSADRFWLA